MIKILLTGLALASSVSMYSVGVQLQETSIHPVWYSTNAGKQVDRDGKITKYRTVCNQLGGSENPKVPGLKFKDVPVKGKNFVRVATYNVHFWRNPFGDWWKSSHPKDDHDVWMMLWAIEMVNADILILQEVGGKENAKWNVIDPEFTKMGYKYGVCASTSQQGVDKDGDLYNCIYSKLPFVGEPIRKQYATNPDLKIAQNHEQRCFVGARIQLPNNKQISVYGTHLEVRPIMAKSPDGKGRGLTPDTARKEQIQELLEYIKTNETNDNVVIGADFNTFRKQDLLDYKIGTRTLWDILEKDWANILKVSDIPEGMGHLADKTPTTMALDYVASQGYKDSFTRGGFTLPQFSVWSGTLIDFLFLSPKWNLGLKGGYAFYSWVSDHIPLIMDIDPSKSVAPVKPTITKPATTKPTTKPTAKPVIGKGSLAGTAAGKAVKQVIPRAK